MARLSEGVQKSLHGEPIAVLPACPESFSGTEFDSHPASIRMEGPALSRECSQSLQGGFWEEYLIHFGKDFLGSRFLSIHQPYKKGGFHEAIEMANHQFFDLSCIHRRIRGRKKEMG
jgi:hypothetical protein